MNPSTPCSSRREEALNRTLEKKQGRKGAEENHRAVTLSPHPLFPSASKIETATNAPKLSETAASPSLSPGERAGERASVITKLHFSLATPTDDPAIRRLLRDNPMPGVISLSLEREPNYFADAHQPGETKQTIVARESDRIVCVGNCTTRLRYVNGQPRRVGYLGGLRLDASVAGRFDILRRGYEFFRELQTASPADFYFTSIAGDNHRARHFLERNLRGMPRYEFIGEFVTLLLPTERRSPTQRVELPLPVGRGEELELTKAMQSELPKAAVRPTSPHPHSLSPSAGERGAGVQTRASTLNKSNQHFQLAPHWTADQLTALHPLGLRADDWFGETALWDQRSFKQTVIRGYAPWLALLRPALNLVSRLAGKPGLPAVGATLSHAFLTNIANADLSFVNHLRSRAAKRSIEWLTLGFAANDPRLPLMRPHFSSREYRSRLYLVRWPDLGGAATDLDHRILAPEIALL